MGEAADWETMSAELAQAEAREEAFLQAEERRRKQMFLGGNYQALGFNLGDILEDEVMGDCEVIGLPTKDAAGPAPGRIGARGQVWVRIIDTRQRVWRTAGHLKKPGGGVPNRTSPRLEQKSIRAQRERQQRPADDSGAVGGGGARKRIIVNSADEEDEEAESEYDTDDEKRGGDAADIPLLAKHERNRKAKQKPQKKKRKLPGALNAACRSSTKQTSVPLSQRLTEFPNMGLSISAGALWCAPCKKVVPNLKQTIDLHVSSTKHKTNFSKHMRRNEREKKLADGLTAYFERHHTETGVPSLIVLKLGT